MIERLGSGGTSVLGPTGAHWLDNPPELTGKDSTPQHAVDDPLLSCNRLRLSPAPLLWGCS